jgi:4-hydroxy-tetrahydrodipicolinate synthase
VPDGRDDARRSMMSTAPSVRGVLAPVVTPFTSALEPDSVRLAAHCRWLVERDVGLAVFGTNSEANSLTVAEKRALLDALIGAGIPPERMIPGTGCCAFPDTVELTRAALRHGCAGVLMLPPFYYKGVSDDGLFATYSEVIERVGDPRLRIYLYHIPPVSQVPLGPALIERLCTRYPDVVAGIKDSSGDWSNTRMLVERFQSERFDVFVGSESYLLETLRAGGAGCISATANVNPAAIAQLCRTWRDARADDEQASLDSVRTAFQRVPMIPALKAAIAHFAGDPAWATVRPPLVASTSAQRAELLAALEAARFSMPGLTRN